MADPIPKINDPEELAGMLGKILVEGPLYRNFVYIGKDCHIEKTAARNPRLGLLPQELKMYCDNQKCKALEWWAVNDQDVYFRSGSFINERYYRCKNCEDSYQHYLFIWQENTDQNIFMKVGQYPALSIEPSPEMEKVLGAEDSELYKKGLIEFQFGHGIGCYNRVDLPANFAANNNPSIPGYAAAGEGSQVPQLSLQIESADVSAITKKLSAKWSMESEQDLFAYHGLNAENELMTGPRGRNRS